MNAQERIIVALDFHSLDYALGFVDALLPQLCWVKVGPQLVTRYGGERIAEELVQKRNLNVFLDVKLNDIPEAVAKTVRNLNALGIAMVTVHVSSGVAALKNAVLNRGAMKVLGVTLLSSFSDEDSSYLYGGNVITIVRRFADDALETETQGIVCPPLALSYIGVSCSHRYRNLLKVVPGIRPSWYPTAAHGHRAQMTPADAIRAGADMLVVGRPVTSPPPFIKDSQRALALTIEEVEQATN